MPFQDILIFAVLLAFNVSTIPLIRGRVPVPLSTSLLMSGGAAILGVTYATMGLWLSVSVEVMSVGLWGVLLVRALRRPVLAPAT